MSTNTSIRYTYYPNYLTYVGVLCCEDPLLRSFCFVCTSSLSFPSCFLSLPIQALHRLIRFLLPALQACNPSSFPPRRSSVSSYPGSTSTCSGLQSFLLSPLSSVSSHPGSTSSCPLTPSNLQSFLLSFVLLSVFLQPQH